MGITPEENAWFEALRACEDCYDEKMGYDLCPIHKATKPKSLIKDM